MDAFIIDVLFSVIDNWIYQLLIHTGENMYCCSNVIRIIRIWLIYRDTRPNF